MKKFEDLEALKPVKLHKQDGSLCEGIYRLARPFPNGYVELYDAENDKWITKDDSTDVFYGWSEIDHSNANGD